MRSRVDRGVALGAVILAAGLWAGCSVEDPGAPALTSPSGFGMAVTLTANKDSLPRDGSSQAEVTATVRDASNNPVSGQRLSVATDIGDVSEAEIVTDGAGHATFAFIAPGPSVPGSVANVRVTPVGSGADAALPRVLTISFTGAKNATAPTPSFTISNTSVAVLENVVFDASETTDEGVACLDACTYAWDFGGEATGAGRLASYRFLGARVYAVTLTVTDDQGSSATLTKNVTVSEGTPPTSSFTFSPNEPAIFETVNFSAEGSSVGEDGRTIVRYDWQFGDGETDGSLNTTHAYSVAQSYTVQLTVTDSAGAQATSSQTITVVNGMTASFTYSPTDPDVGEEVFFNAEGSLGSPGFGGRNPIVNYIWHFGEDNDSEVTGLPVISHRFTDGKTFTVTLTVVDSAGRRATTSKTVAVNP